MIFTFMCSESSCLTFIWAKVVCFTELEQAFSDLSIMSSNLIQSFYVFLFMHLMH